jgi:hypothetical protein
MMKKSDLIILKNKTARLVRAMRHGVPGADNELRIAELLAEVEAVLRRLNQASK